MRYIDQWLSGLGLDHVIPLLQAHGITTPKKLAVLTLRDIYEVVGVEDSEDRKKLYFLIQRLQSILKKDKGNEGGQEEESPESTPETMSASKSSGSLSPHARNKNKNKKKSSLSPSPHRKKNVAEKSPQDDPSVPRSSFLDVSPLRTTAKRENDTTPRNIRDHKDRVSSTDDHSDAHDDSTVSESSSDSKAQPAATTVREDLKLLRRQHKPSSSRDEGLRSGSLSPPRDSSNSAPDSQSSVRYISPIVPKADQLKQKKKRGPVAVPMSGNKSPSRSMKNSIARQSPPPSPPPVSPSASANYSSPSPPPRVQTKLNKQAYSPPAPVNEDDFVGSENDMAIRVVVRKRPISRSELKKNDVDILDVSPGGKILVHEPKTKVDLTKVVETQGFFFDDAFDYDSSNEEIYARVIRNLVATMFEGGKGSCFAYGQTGSGKTFTMMGSNPSAPADARRNAGLYVLAARDIFHLLSSRETHCQLMVSCFEIYGGKLFDLLNGRNPVKCLEDSKQRVQTPGLTEHCVRDVEELLEMMSQAHAQRSTGSTGANTESSRSHQILQLQLVEERKQKNGKVLKRPCGKLSFIDLAGSERGADTSKNSKQTRLEGAEINTSLLALKEVIRSLERKHGHTPFRGSKLTQVLKDSFVGEKTKTCMVACVSPSISNCEHTLNTLRYADRVKEHQQSNSEERSRPATAASQSSDPHSQAGIRKLNLDNNMLAVQSKGAKGVSRPSTSGQRPDEEDFRIEEVGRGVKKSMKKRGSMLTAAPRNPGTDLNRLSVGRMSLNGPPPPPEEEDTPATVANTGIRLRKGTAENGSVKLRKGHSNQDPHHHHHHHHARRGTPPPPPPQESEGFTLSFPSPLSPEETRHAKPSSEKSSEKRGSLSSPILHEHVDKHSRSVLFEDRAAEALMSLSELASSPLSSGGSKSKPLVSANDESYSSDSEDGGQDLDQASSEVAQSSSHLLSKTVALVSAHKQAIAEMVDVMKQEMDLVQNMEATDDRDSEAYANTLEALLLAKKKSIGALKTELRHFQKFREK